MNLPFNLYYGKIDSFYENYAIYVQAKYWTNSFYHTSSFTSLTKTKDLLFMFVYVTLVEKNKTKVECIYFVLIYLKISAED